MKFFKIFFIELVLVSSSLVAQPSKLNTQIKILDEYVSKNLFKTSNAKLNCNNNWQKIILNNEGKIIQASGGYFMECHLLEKFIYFRDDSLIAYREIYHPQKNKKCENVLESEYLILKEQDKYIAYDEIADSIIKIDNYISFVNDLDLHINKLHLDYNSICHNNSSSIDIYIQSTNNLILKNKLKVISLKDSNQKNTKYIGYYKEDDLVLLKSINKDTISELIHSLYFKNHNLVDYSFDKYEIKNDSSILVIRDRFQLENSQIRNFNYLDLSNTSYFNKSEKEITHLISEISKSFTQIFLTLYTNNKKTD